MYFRFVAQSSRSKSIILVVTKVSFRPTRDIRRIKKVTPVINGAYV
jgi:hypothetical protein